MTKRMLEAGSVYAGLLLAAYFRSPAFALFNSEAVLLNCCIYPPSGFAGVPEPSHHNL